MEKYIVFLGILRVYQQFSREKIKPERHLIIQERKKPTTMSYMEEKAMQKY